MGLLDLFSKDKRDERARTKNIERAVNKHAQSLDRMKALEALANDGSDEALYGLLRRFGMAVPQDHRGRAGEGVGLRDPGGQGQGRPARRAPLPAVAPTRSPGRCGCWTRSPTARRSWPRSRRCWPGTSRATSATPPRRSSCSTTWAPSSTTRPPPLVAPYLKDMDEGVRFTAVEALLRQKREDVAREPLLELFISDEEESLRIRLRISEGFAELGWLVHGHRGGVEKKLPDAFQLDREGHIKRAAPGVSPSAGQVASAQTRRHQERAAHRLGPDRHRPGLRVRLLRAPRGSRP